MLERPVLLFLLLLLLLLLLFLFVSDVLALAGVWPLTNGLHKGGREGNGCGTTWPEVSR